jgi:Uma2 family endonuclease
VEELRAYFGMIPAERILLDPPPGTATEKDLIRVNRRRDRICELVDGVLVEKAMGFKESWLTGILIHLTQTFLDRHDLGILVGPDAILRLVPGLIRAPDVSFISWDSLPGGEVPEEPIPDLAPDLAIEVISKSNTKKEIERKLQDYFDRGVRLAWVVRPKTRTVEVYTAPKQFQRLHHDQTLDGGDVLPGFTLPLAQSFAPRRRPRGR